MRNPSDYSRLLGRPSLRKIIKGSKHAAMRRMASCSADNRSSRLPMPRDQRDARASRRVHGGKEKCQHASYRIHFSLN